MFAFAADGFSDCDRVPYDASEMPMRDRVKVKKAEVQAKQACARLRGLLSLWDLARNDALLLEN